MADDHTRTFASNGRPAPLRAAAHLGGRAAASALRPVNGAVGAALRPVNGAVGAALSVGMTLQRRAVDRVLDSPELERVIVEVVESDRVQTALSSEAANRLVDSFFDSGMFDRLIERLLESEALWNMIDEIAQSPAVMAAVSQQGLTFADQVGGQVRDRSRRADDWLERAASRIVRRRNREAPETAVLAATAATAATAAAAAAAATVDAADAPVPAVPPETAAMPETPEPTPS